MRRLSLVVASGGHSSSQCAGLSLSRPLLLQSTGSRRAGSVLVAHGPSCSAACGIFPDQGSNPCPLHWQEDSQPLHHQGSPIHSFFKKINLFMAVLGTRCCAWASSSCGEWGPTLHCGARASHCRGLSCCGVRAPGMQASVVVARGLSSCGSRALEWRLSSCGARAQLLRGMWDPPGPGLEPMSPALAGRLPTTAPPGKLLHSFF